MISNLDEYWGLRKLWILAIILYKLTLVVKIQSREGNNPDFTVWVFPQDVVFLQFQEPNSPPPYKMSYSPYSTKGAFTPNVKSELSKNLGGILVGTQC